MTETRFWMIRHAIVEENARTYLYGTMDVGLCPVSLETQTQMYQSLAKNLPRKSQWLVSPLSRTRRTAEAILRAGYPDVELLTEPGLMEQEFGDWQGTPYSELASRLASPAHPFWPVAAGEAPPGGENFGAVIERVGQTMDRLSDTYAGRDVVAVAHGGTIRAAVAHAMGIAAQSALHLSIQNLSLTRLDRVGDFWRVACVNDVPGY